MHRPCNAICNTVTAALGRVDSGPGEQQCIRPPAERAPLRPALVNSIFDNFHRLVPTKYAGREMDVIGVAGPLWGRGRLALWSVDFCQ